MELLVTRADTTHPHDPVLCAQRHKAGDVIEVMPDGHGWSERERTHPDWAILRMPLVAEAEARTLLAQGMAAPDSGKLATIRRFHLDLAKVPADVSHWTHADLLRVRLARVAPPDPAHIGPDMGVIG